MFNLTGIHEPGTDAADLWGGKPGTVVFTEAIGSNPNDKSGGDYRWWSDRGFRVLVRLNNGYKPDGTIPSPSLYKSFAQRCANYVAASVGCNEWIIGNEPNHEQERPHGQEIRPGEYALCYTYCRLAIKQVQSNAKVLVAGPAPWNQQSGDWLGYWRMVLLALNVVADPADGFALHGYTHGTDPNLVESDQKVNGWFWHLRTLEDQMLAIPNALRHLPVDVTETNQGDDPWADTNSGWVKRAVQWVDGWNRRPDTQKIRSISLYRWPRYDQKYSFADKNGVKEDFRQACQLGLIAPEVGGSVEPQSQEQVFMPSISTGGDKSAPVERNISEDFKQRVQNNINFLDLKPGQRGYRLIEAGYYPDGASRFGPDHHILVEVLDANGNRQMGVPVHFYWGNGEAPPVATNKVGGPYAADYGMTSAGHSFGVWVGNDRAASDSAFGMGLGKLGNEHMGDHVTYRLVFQEAVGQQAIEQPSQPPVASTQPAAVPALAHPVTDSRYRNVTQVFGVNGDYYKRFKVDGVPLRGHNGIDFGTPVGTPIVAVDDGVVVEVANDPGGYGKYVKLVHPWGESLYAHLNHQDVPVGARLVRGVQLGLSGNTGKSTGPHLHFGMRVHPFNRADGWGGYIDPAPYLTATPSGPFIQTRPTEPKESHAPVRDTYLKWFRQYGEQYAVPWHLLAALAYSENKYQTQPTSHMGAQGLMQFMPATWADMQTQLGVTDPLDPEQSIMAAAYYLAQIRSYLGRFKRYGDSWMLAGYNWGMGRSAQEPWEKVPPETKAYIDEILEHSEALRRWEDGWQA